MPETSLTESKLKLRPGYKDGIAHNRNLGYGREYRRASFTVPADVGYERVYTARHKIMKRFAEALWKEGYRIVAMSEPDRDWTPTGLLIDTNEPDRISYIMWALVEKKMPFKLWVPDERLDMAVAAGATPVVKKYY